MKALKDSLKIVASLPAKINAAKKRMQSIAAEGATLHKRMAQLDRAGLIRATPVWRKDTSDPTVPVRERKGKYLYLIYPMKDGKRDRVYVGADPAKIKAALAGIERAQEYDQLKQKADEIEWRLNSGYQALRVAAESCGNW